MAEQLKVTTRTLRSWSKIRKRGRKKAEVTLRDMLAVAREWKKQGRPGSRPIINALPRIRVRLVRDLVAGLKKRQHQRCEKIRTQVRVRIKVKRPGAFVVMDGATVAKEDFIVFRDRGSTSTHAEACPSHLNSNDTLRILKKMKDSGQLPLVVGTDNGSPFCSRSVEKFYEENKIIHLRSLPHVPQQNGSAENAVNDFKILKESGHSTEQVCQILNLHRRRASQGWKTPTQVEQTTMLAYTNDDRARFYDAVSLAKGTALLGTRTAYEKRKAEREAILQTMERFGLITRTRGQSTRLTKAEVIT